MRWPIRALQKKHLFPVIVGAIALLVAIALGLGVLEAKAGRASAATYWTRAALGLLGMLVILTLPRLAAAASFAQFPFEVPFYIAPLGWIYFTLLAVALMAAMLTGNNLFYLILSVLIATLIVSVLVNKLNLTKLEIEMRPPAHMYANEPTQVQILLSNHKRLLPTFSLSVSLLRQAAPARNGWPATPALVRLAHFAIIPGRAQASFTATHTFARRGKYPLRSLTVRTRFPFGLVERQVGLLDDGEWVVYPPLQPLTTFAAAPLAEVGKLESSRRGYGSDLYALRPYQAADLRRAIDWKATAKTAQLIVRENARDEEWRVTLALDSTVPLSQAEPFEKALAFLTSLIDHFIARGAAVRLVAGEFTSIFGEGRAHGFALLRELAQLEAIKETIPPTPLPPLAERLPGLDQSAEAQILLTPLTRAELARELSPATQVISFNEISNDIS